MTRAASQLLFLAIFSVIAPTLSFAEELDNQAKALREIRSAATEICGTVEREGSRTTVELSGDVKAKLGRVVARIADLGIEGAGKYRIEEYKNVLQEDLAAVLKSTADCKLEVFKLLQEKMIVPSRYLPSESPARVIQDMKSNDPAIRTAAIARIAASTDTAVAEAAFEDAIKSNYADVRCWAVRTKFMRVRDFRVELSAGDGTAKSIADAQTNNSSAYSTVSDVKYNLQTGQFHGRWRAYGGNVSCGAISFSTDSICMGTLVNRIGTWEFSGRVSCRYYQGTAPFKGVFLLH